MGSEMPGWVSMVMEEAFGGVEVAELVLGLTEVELTVVVVMVKVKAATVGLEVGAAKGEGAAAMQVATVVATMVSGATAAAHLEGRMEGRLVVAMGMVAEEALMAVAVVAAVAAVAAVAREVAVKGRASVRRVDLGDSIGPRGRSGGSHGMQSRRAMCSRSPAGVVMEMKQAEQAGALGREELPRRNSRQTKCCGLWSSNRRCCSGWQTCSSPQG